MGEEIDAVTAQEARAGRFVAILLFLFCVGSALMRLPGALHGTPAPVSLYRGEWGEGPPVPVPAWTDQGQAMFLVVVYTLLALVCLYFVARPLPRKRG